MTGPRLTDAEALRQLDRASRAAVKRYGFVRCLVAPNAWHHAVPITPPDYGNGPAPHYAPCRCRVARKARTGQKDTTT